MRRSGLPPHTLLGVATCLLVLVVTTRAALGWLAPAPARARELLGAESTRFPRGRLLLLADSADAAWLGDAAATARRRNSDLPLELRIVGSGDEVPRQMRRLVRAYGIERLPVLLTLDAEARVLRVEPLSPQPSPSGS